MVAGDRLIARIGQRRREVLRRAVVVIVLAGQDQRRRGDMVERIARRVDEGVENVQQRDRIAPGRLQERLGQPFAAATREAAEVGQHVVEIAAAPGGIDNALQPHARDDRATWRRAIGEHPHRGAAAERIAGEIIIGEAEMRDQRKAVAHQHVGRIGGGIVRLGAVAVRAQIRHDDAETRLGNPRGMAIFDPVDRRVGEIAVDQDDRASLPDLAPRQAGAIEAVEELRFSRGVCQ